MEGLTEEMIQEIPKSSIWTKQLFLNISTTLVYYYTYVCLGFLISSLGWSNIQLQRNTDSSIEKIGFLFTARGTAWFFGSIISGKVLDIVSSPKFKFKHIIHPHFLYALILCIIVLLYTLIPIITNYYLLLLIHFTYGGFGGMLDVFPNVLIMWIWKEKSGPWIQFLHACFGIGSFTSPFIAGLIMDGGNMMRFFWSFWIISLLFLLCISFFIVIPAPNVGNEEEILQNADQENVPKQKFNLLKLISKEFLLSLVIALLLGAYVGGEVAYGGLLSNYFVELKFGDVKQAAYLTSGFWLSFTVGRFISGILSIFLDSRIYISTSFSISLIGLVLILIFSSNLTILWISTLLVGFFYGPIYAIALSYPSTVLKIQPTGLMTSFMVFSKIYF
jgi:MFS transporter, FHS family, Na+ dependent glucose transporter 1